MLRKLLITLMLILYMFNFTACIYSDNADSTVEPTKNVRYAMDYLPQGFAYSKEEIYNNLEVYTALFHGLLGKGEDGELLPVLSEYYEVLDHGLEYRFYLREDIFWSDGRPITAQDFVNFFQELLSPQGEDYLAEGLRAVFGVSSYHKGSVPFNKVAIMSSEEHELIFRLNYPYEEFLEVLARPEYYLRGPLASLEKLSQGYESALYTGPFILKEYESASMLLSRNPYYPDTENIFKSSIEITQMTTPEKTLTDFYLGKIDLFKNPPISELSALKEKQNIDLRLNDLSYMLYFSTEKENMDLYIKKAINEAIYAYSLEHQQQELIFAEYAYGEAFYEKESIHKDIATNAEANKDPVSLSNRIKEQALLSKQYYKASEISKALKPSSKGKLTLLVGNSMREKKIGDFIKKALEETLDIECRIKQGSPEDTAEGLYDIYLGAFQTKDKAAFLSNFYSGAEARTLGYIDEQYDDLYRGYLMEEDAERKKNLLEASKNYLQNNYAYLPLFYDNDTICHRSTIEGISFDREGRLILKELNKFKMSEENLKDKPIKDLSIPIGKGLHMTALFLF